MSDEAEVYVRLSYDAALRLAYIASIRDDRAVLPGDEAIAGKINEAIGRTESAWAERSS